MRLFVGLHEMSWSQWRFASGSALTKNQESHIAKRGLNSRQGGGHTSRGVSSTGRDLDPLQDRSEGSLESPYAGGSPKFDVWGVLRISRCINPQLVKMPLCLSQLCTEYSLNVVLNWGHNGLILSYPWSSYKYYKGESLEHTSEGIFRPPLLFLYLHRFLLISVQDFDNLNNPTAMVGTTKIIRSSWPT